MTAAHNAQWERYNEDGLRRFAQGDLAGAEQAFVAAVREAERLGEEDLPLAASLSNLGQLQYRQRRYDAAESPFRRSLAIRERRLGADHPGVVQSINNLAALHYAREQLDDAERLFRRALEITDRSVGASHADIATCLNNLARLYLRRNDLASAGPALARLLVLREEALGATHPEVATVLTTLASLRSAQGKHAAAEQLAQRALTIRQGALPPSDPAVEAARLTLARIRQCGNGAAVPERGQLGEASLPRGIRLDQIVLRGDTSTRDSILAPAPAAASAAVGAASAPPAGGRTTVPAAAPRTEESPESAQPAHRSPAPRRTAASAARKPVRRRRRRTLRGAVAAAAVAIAATTIPTVREALRERLPHALDVLVVRMSGRDAGDHLVHSSATRISAAEERRHEPLTARELLPSPAGDPDGAQTPVRAAGTLVADSTRPSKRSVTADSLGKSPRTGALHRVLEAISVVRRALGTRADSAARAADQSSPRIERR